MTELTGDISSPGVVFKRKYRWTVGLLKGEEVVRTDWFVRVIERPPAPIQYPDGCRFEMNFSWMWGMPGFTPPDFDTVRLRMYDGCGVLIEEWTLGEAKLGWIRDEGEGFDPEVPGQHCFSFEVTYDPNKMHYKLHQENYFPRLRRVEQADPCVVVEVKQDA